MREISVLYVITKEMVTRSLLWVNYQENKSLFIDPIAKLNEFMRIIGMESERIIFNLFYPANLKNLVTFIVITASSEHSETEFTTSQCHPSSIIQFAEHPSPLSLLPSSHW